MEEFVEVSVFDEDYEKICKFTTYEELSKKYKNRFKSSIVLAKHDNKLRELSSKIKTGGKIEFFDITDVDGMRVYIRSVSFLMVKAVKEVIGMDTNVAIEHSVNKNLYCEIRKSGIAIDNLLLNKIENKMNELVNMDIPIIKEAFKRDDAIVMLSSFGMNDKAELFKFRRSSNINLYKMGKFYDYFYGYMVPSTGYLKKFKLIPDGRGFLIQFPSMSEPNIIPEYKRLDKISEVFIEQMDWLQIMNVNNVADLNDLICNGKFGDLVRINEALHEKKIAKIADEISERIDSVKVVLIAGPSSSGKTTFAQRLGVQLKVNGINPHVISLDDYFINREDTPLDEFGKHDFENINSLDVELFNNNLISLISGERVELPSYNFITGRREYKGNYYQLKEGEIFVIEGIHGLNDVLTQSIPNNNKFRIFISAMTQLNIDDHNRISTSDSRLIRRLVRDYHFRGNDAAVTIDTWPYVTRGEAKNIFPYQENSDAIFNSATIYELSILKQYVEPILFKIDKSMPEYITAKRIIKFLDYFLGVSSECIPNNSIIREFIGGSCFNV